MDISCDLSVRLYLACDLSLVLEIPPLSGEPCESAHVHVFVGSDTAVVSLVYVYILSLLFITPPLTGGYKITNPAGSNPCVYY